MVGGDGLDGDQVDQVGVGNQGDGGEGPFSGPKAVTCTAGSSRERGDNDKRMGGRKEVQGGMGEGNGVPMEAMERYLGFCNLFITPEQVEHFHEDYSKGVRDSQEHLFKAYVALRSATEGSALNAVEKVCRNSIPSKLPSATKPKSRHVDGNYDLCSAQWTEKLSAPKGCPTTQTVAALKAELHTLGLSTSGTKVQFTSWLYCSHNFSGGTSFKAS